MAILDIWLSDAKTIWSTRDASYSYLAIGAYGDAVAVVFIYCIDNGAATFYSKPIVPFVVVITVIIRI